MITHYNLSYNQNPKHVANRVKRENKLQVVGGFCYRHDEKVSDNCTFHIWNGPTMSRAEFIEKYAD